MYQTTTVTEALLGVQIFIIPTQLTNSSNILLFFLKCFGLLPGVNFWCMTNVSGSLVCPIFRVLGKNPLYLLHKTLKMGQTSDPETLVIHQKLTPGNPKNFKQHYDHGGSIQLHTFISLNLLRYLNQWNCSYMLQQNAYHDGI
jgi:hypothetical protein